jgi:hypothetical protein
MPLIDSVRLMLMRRFNFAGAGVHAGVDALTPEDTESKASTLSLGGRRPAGAGAATHKEDVSGGGSGTFLSARENIRDEWLGTLRSIR